MALSYMERHGAITAKEYARMTGLNKKAAEAELDAFAYNRRLIVSVLYKNKKKVYIIKSNGNCRLYGFKR